MRVPDTLAFLYGRWQVERLIIDHRSGIRGVFRGTAQAAAAQTGLAQAGLAQAGLARAGLAQADSAQADPAQAGSAQASAAQAGAGCTAAGAPPGPLRSGPRAGQDHEGGSVAAPQRVLYYAEHGQLQFGQHAGPARRSLIFCGRADGTAAVRFADRRPFYLLDLRDGHWQAEHLCGADRYLLSHCVLGADLLEERWQVRGPDADYEAVTTFNRESAG